MDTMFLNKGLQIYSSSLSLLVLASLGEHNKRVYGSRPYRSSAQIASAVKTFIIGNFAYPPDVSRSTRTNNLVIECKEEHGNVLTNKHPWK
jgi:hypothetical protein